MRDLRRSTGYVQRNSCMPVLSKVFEHELLRLLRHNSHSGGRSEEEWRKKRLIFKMLGIYIPWFCRSLGGFSSHGHFILGRKIFRPRTDGIRSRSCCCGLNNFPAFRRYRPLGLRFDVDVWLREAMRALDELRRRRRGVSVVWTYLPHCSVGGQRKEQA